MADRWRTPISSFNTWKARFLWGQLRWWLLVWRTADSGVSSNMAPVFARLALAELHRLCRSPARPFPGVAVVLRNSDRSSSFVGSSPLTLLATVSASWCRATLLMMGSRVSPRNLKAWAARVTWPSSSTPRGRPNPQRPGADRNIGWQSYGGGEGILIPCLTAPRTEWCPTSCTTLTL